jgi:hypothetical protein
MMMRMMLSIDNDSVVAAGVDLEEEEVGTPVLMSNFNSMLSILCIMDHGGRPNAFSVDDGITLGFAGPNRTADDVMVEDCQWLRRVAAEQLRKPQPQQEAEDQVVVDPQQQR